MPSEPVTNSPPRLAEHWQNQADLERRAGREPSERQRSGARIAAIVSAAVGIIATGWVLRLPVTDTRFFPITSVLGLIWLCGTLVTFRLSGQRFPRGVRWPRALVLGLGAGLALLAVFVLGALLVSRLPMLRDPVLELIGHAGHGTLLVAIAATALNGVAEECFFRGALFQVLAGRGAIIGSTAVYALSAAASGIALLVLAAILLGLVAAILRRLTGGIVAPAAAHVAWSLGMLLLLPLLLGQ